MGRREERKEGEEEKKMKATESTEDTEGIILSALGVLGGKENYLEGGKR